jgi:hypothetical protein
MWRPPGGAVDADRDGDGFIVDTRVSRARIAGMATAIWTPTSAKCAGHTSSATSAVTPTGWPSRRPSANSARHSPTRYSPPGAPTSTNITTASDSRPRLSRSRPNCATCSKTPRRRIGATAGTVSSPTTCSRSGPRSEPSPSSTGSSRLTTLPNARSAAPSSTENSRSAPNARTVSGSLHAPSRPPPHAECSAARCSPTSANYSPPTTAATRSPRSPERPRGLNGDSNPLICR